MDEVPEYACRVKGDGESWGRVLSMQGYGNAGSAPRTTGYRANSAGADGDDGNEAASAEVASAVISGTPRLIALGKVGTRPPD